MAMVTVKLKPGVNVEQTPTLLEAGYALSNLMRFRASLAEKLGGWIRYYANIISGVPKALHAWQDLNEIDRLAVGTTTTLGYVEDGAFIAITPQTKTTDFQPDFSTTSGSPNVTVTDSNIANVTGFDSIEFHTPVAVGGLILSGVYPIDVSLSATSYRIIAAANATAARGTLTITAITQANPGVVTYSGADNIANGDLVYIYGVVGMTQVNGLLFTVANLNAGANTFELSGVNTTTYTAYASGGTVSAGAVPQFTTTSGSATVSVTLTAHGLTVGDTINFPLSTTVGGVTISGTYSATAIGSANAFSISAANSASSSATAMMNAGQAELLYYIAIGPQAAFSGYSVGTYSSGAYSTGTSTSAQTGTAITSTDWTLDNWGQVLLACPHGGALYYWEPATGFSTARPITGSGAPIRNTGMFVSMQTQMLIAYGSTEEQTIGLDTDPLLVKWCAQSDYLEWEPSITNQAGSRRLSTGSKIVSGLSVPQQELLWTDLDLWSMSYLGYPDAWGFTKLGANCGLIGKHAVVRQGTNIYWMGFSNFFVLGGGVQPIPCTVWDAVFQDLNTTYQAKCWAWSNTPFNEVWFFYPRLSTGATEPDAYVKVNTLTGEWDNGADDLIDRSCGIDTSLLGKPIAASPTGLIYQHETGYDGDGVPLNPYIETGWFTLSEGHDVMFADWILYDMLFKNFNSSNQSAQIQVTLYSAMYPNDTPRVYGPYTFTSASLYKNIRLRGRLMKLRFESADAGSWWRLGAPKLRIAPSGTR